MPFDVVDVSTLLPALPDQVWAAWMDGALHAAMTGASATCDPRVGGPFTAWDGYIRGTNLELERPRRIVQAWRTTRFSTADPDSRLEVLLDPETGGTRVRLLHTGLPAGQGSSYASGWETHYFEPMRRFFGRR